MVLELRARQEALALGEVREQRQEAIDAGCHDPAYRERAGVMRSSRVYQAWLQVQRLQEVQSGSWRRQVRRESENGP